MRKVLLNWSNKDCRYPCPQQKQKNLSSKAYRSLPRVRLTAAGAASQVGVSQVNPKGATAFRAHPELLNGGGLSLLVAVR